MSEAAQVVSVTRRHVVCPACGKPAGTVDHMIEDAEDEVKKGGYGA